MFEETVNGETQCCHMCEGIKKGCLRQISRGNGIKNWIESEAE